MNKEEKYFHIIGKIKQIENLHKNEDVATKVFGVNKGTVSNWRKRGIPIKRLVAYCEKKEISIDELLSDSPKQPIIKEENGFPFGVDPEKDPKLYNIVQMLKGDEETQCAIYDFLESKKHFDRASSVMRQFMMRKAGIWFAGTPGGDDHERTK